MKFKELHLNPLPFISICTKDSRVNSYKVVWLIVAVLGWKGFLVNFLKRPRTKFLSVFLAYSGVRTGPWKPGKSWNLKIWFLGLESPGIFVEVLESPGIWTYRSIFLIISIHEFSRYTSSKIWVYLLSVKSLWIHWKGPWIWHWKVLESPGIWDVKMYMNPDIIKQCMLGPKLNDNCGRILLLYFHTIISLTKLMEQQTQQGYYYNK